MAGNPPSRRAPFLGLHTPPGSPGRLLQRAEPPHPHRVTPPGGKQHRIRDDLAVRSPDSSREILRAIGVDQHLRTSAPCRTVRLPRHVPDLPARELPLKLAPTLTVPHGLSPHPRSTRPSPGHVSHRQTRRDSLRRCQSTTPRRPQPTGCARGSLQELIRLFDAPRPGVSDLFSGVWVPAGNSAADPRFVLGIFAGPQVFHSGASTVSAVPAPPRSAASQPAAASYPGPGSPGRTITVPRRELVPGALRAVSLATGRHDRNLGS